MVHQRWFRKSNMGFYKGLIFWIAFSKDDSNMDLLLKPFYSWKNVYVDASHQKAWTFKNQNIQCSIF
jgi:hypothetical protein